MKICSNGACGFSSIQKGINHKKAMLLDEDWLMVGSANSDNRSMRLNFELNLLAHASAAGGGTRAAPLREFESSKEIQLENSPSGHMGSRLLEAALRPLAPLL